MWYVLACLFGRNPLIANPSLPYVGWMLLAHLFIPKTPKNSIDSAIAWKMPTSVHLASWVVLAVSYSYSGYTKLLSPSWLEGKNLLYVLYNPLARDYFLRDFFLRIPSIFLSLITWGILIIELLFAFLILKKRVRPYMWLSMLIVQFGFAFLLSFPDLTIAMLLFHLFTFDPAWLESKAAANSGILFYDGDCGLCHGVVRFLLAEDHRQIFQMSPLQGEKFKTILEPGKQVTMKDSVVLVIKDRALTRSTAIVYLLKNLGGLWTILGYILFFFPKFIRDFGYDCVGTIRHCLFPKPSGFCPILPESLRGRLL
ncbi:MAG: DCC1-like thiol-disulfide oxidoreductase family protein [Pseudomonadota bacterium]